MLPSSISQFVIGRYHYFKIVEINQDVGNVEGATLLSHTEGEFVL